MANVRKEILSIRNIVVREKLTYPGGPLQVVQNALEYFKQIDGLHMLTWIGIRQKG